MFRIKMASVQELNTGIQTFDTRNLAPERVYKVKAKMCLEKCLIPKHCLTRVGNLMYKTFRPLTF